MGSYTRTDGSIHQLGDVWFTIGTDGSRVFDLSALNPASMAQGSLPHITMTAGTNSETLKLKLADVLNFGATDLKTGITTMMIDGHANDTLMMLQSDQSWSMTGSTHYQGEQYTVYASDHAQLLVNDKIHSVIL